MGSKDISSCTQCYQKYCEHCSYACTPYDFCSIECEEAYEQDQEEEDVEVDVDDEYEELT